MEQEVTIPKTSDICGPFNERGLVKDTELVLCVDSALQGKELALGLAWPASHRGT